MNIQTDLKLISHYLAKFNLQTTLPAADPRLIQVHTFKAGELILREGDDIAGLYLQVEGQAKISTSVTTGKSLLLRFCSPLSIYGDIEYIQGVPVQSQVEAVTDTTLLFIVHELLEEIFEVSHVLKNLLLQHLSYKLLTCTSASRTNSLGSVEERLAGYLLTIQSSREFGKEIQTTVLPDIASLIGTTPRHLNRVLRKLAQAGVLKKDNHKILVLRWEELDRLSKGIRYE